MTSPTAPAAGLRRGAPVADERAGHRGGRRPREGTWRRPPRHAGLRPRRRTAGAAAGVVGLPLLTVALLRVDHVELATALLAYVTLTVIVAAIGGIWPGTVVAVAGFAAGNWYFTRPLRTWSVDHVQELLALAAFLTTAVVVSALVDRETRRTSEVQVARAQSTALTLDKQRLEAQAARAEAQAEANRLRTSLLSAVSHDLRTPLATIKAWLTGLLDDDAAFDHDTTREIVRAAVAEADRLNTLVGNLLDMGRLQSGALHANMQPVEIDAIAATAVAGLGYHSDQVHLLLPDSLPPVLADAALLERVLANVVDNAVRHSPADTPCEVRAHVGGRTMEVHVVDRGEGIPLQRRETVFQPFQRLDDHTGGVGLGLAVARGLTVALDADLRITDTPGGGTTMVLRLQVAP
jgi:two-component system sensor histidine kinase KdpD